MKNWKKSLEWAIPVTTDSKTHEEEYNERIKATRTSIYTLFFAGSGAEADYTMDSSFITYIGQSRRLAKATKAVA